MWTFIALKRLQRLLVVLEGERGVKLGSVEGSHIQMVVIISSEFNCHITFKLHAQTFS
jgi:hypothetical protein